MLRYVVSRLLRNPFIFIRNALYKTLIGPLKYARGDDYDARRYWRDRFAKHGTSLRGPGDEGISEKDNRKAYDAAGRLFIELCIEEGIDFENASVLEIGVGTGFYTGLLHQAGARKYSGVDITDVLFPNMSEKYPDFEFTRKDITSDKIEGKFDLIVMMDVVEHIVNESKLTSTMENIKGCLSEGGVFVLSGIQKKNKKRLFYNYSWSPDDIVQRFPGYDVKGPVPFRENNLLIMLKERASRRQGGLHMSDRTETEYPHEAYDEAYYQCLADEAGRNAASHRLRMRWLDEMLDIKPGEQIVDLGSGTGQVTEHLAGRGATVDAVDQEKEAVDFARKRCRHLKQVRFHLCDARNCSHLQSSAYDKVTCCDLIEHVYDDVMLDIFREAHRLLKPGGVLYVYSPNVRHWIERLKARNFILKQPVGHIRVRRIEEVSEALNSCGFEIARIARFPSMLPIIRYFEWLWIRLPFYPQIAIYRISLLARKPSG